ncbi:MAG: hypothetical protein K2O12_07335 [Muribaculaceae bacterium]|nr:hypothetical protein [Muribaculaceae bacterium]
MHKLFYAAALSAAALFIFSCRSGQPAVLPQIRHDSLRAVTFNSDTLIVRDSVTIDRRSDTVYNTRTRIIYRTRNVRDTLNRVVRDTVSIAVPQVSAAGDGRALSVPWWVLACIAVVFLRRR